jgi:hypothetical protein
MQPGRAITAKAAWTAECLETRPAVPVVDSLS